MGGVEVKEIGKGRRRGGVGSSGVPVPKQLARQVRSSSYRFDRSATIRGNAEDRRTEQGAAYIHSARS